MRYAMQTGVRRLALLALFAGAVPAAGQAQAGSSRGPVPTRVPVTVALVDRLSAAQSPFSLLRRSPAEGGDVILMPATADAHDDWLIGQFGALPLERESVLGLSEEEATTMVVSGFIEPLVKELPMEYAVEMNRLIALQMEGSIG